MADEKVLQTEIVFESTGRKRGEPQTLTISGPTDLRNAPEKILQLMDLLELPKGTKATLKVTAASSVVR
jgi:hypothetical protein